MLDADTKRRIDTARDILVGKVPDPKSQVEQITIALIYKFMDDMDAESEEFGGKRNFFAGDFARYGWAKLMRSGLGGYETLNLYAEAITKMPENPGIPLLFRDIFKNAYLPYRDPETLKMFLKVIDEFAYDHSERLGDAFEYLLSVLGSQGDAGQFRTPRHIIDFMVKIINPQKDEVVLDPACGTAGFLISSYKHILGANTDEKGNSTLTPDDKGRLAQHFRGYDISPDMVRLSLVNLYLHGFADPHIYEYDTLSSQERWNETADVILANPPFMSPKGGIQPHNRFTVQSKRSEVLFVDYMAEHLTPNGRAGIIVPEGIIFQSGKAYVQLRRMLVESALVAVISLPAGVFNPYSGVKTSILILDKALAKKASTVAFFKVENDGFSLGAQRREIEQNDLPQVLQEMQDYLQMLRAGETVKELQPGLGLMVAREKLAANGEYNLSGERYRENNHVASQFPLKKFEDVCTLEYGASLPQRNRISGPFPVVGSNGVTGYHNEPLISGPAIIIGRKGSAGEVTLIEDDCFPIDTTYYVKLVEPNKTDLVYLYWVLKSMNLHDLKGGAGVPGLNRLDVYHSQKIPLPPLEVQKEIVAEIESYQKVIDGARAVVENYKPRIAIDPDWPMVELGEVCAINPDTINPISEFPNLTIFYIDISSVENFTGKFLGYTEILSSDAPSRARRGIRNDDVLLSTVRPNLQAFTLLKELPHRAIASTGFAVLRAHPEVIDPIFLLNMVRSDSSLKQMVAMMEKGAYPSINQSDVASIVIPLPPISVQKVIASEINNETSLVESNRILIARFEEKIQMVLDRVWGKQEKDQE